MFAEGLEAKMHARNHQYPYKILLLPLKLFIKLKQNSFSVACITLQTYLDDHDDDNDNDEQLSYCNKYALQTVFSSEDEGKLIDDTTTANHIHYGLTQKAVTESTHELAKKPIKKYPNSRDVNGQAGVQWITDITIERRNNPSKVSKQMGHVTSGETRVNGCVNALGNSIPPVLIFPHNHSNKPYVDQCTTWDPVAAQRGTNFLNFRTTSFVM